MRHSISIERDDLSFVISNQVLSVDALNAISTINGTTEVRIENETEVSVVISYNWTLDEKFEETAGHLAKFGLKKSGW